MANVGNLFYSFYVFNLPPGPIWVLHTFYLASSALMLLWSCAMRPSADSTRSTDTKESAMRTNQRAHRDRDHRRRPGRPRHRVPPPAARAPLRDS